MIHALHGNLGAPEDWDSLGLENFRAVDLWSWQEKCPGMTLEGFGKAFAEEVAAMDPEPILLGYSLGGRLALHAMAARPDLWKEAILVSTHPGLEMEEERVARREQDRQWAQKAREGDWVEFLGEWNAQSVLAGQGPSDAQRALEGRREAIAQGFESWSLGHQLAMEKGLKDCGIPVRALAGEKDAKFCALMDRIRTIGERTQIKVIAGCGHRILKEAPERLAEEIGRWIEASPKSS